MSDLQVHNKTLTNRHCKYITSTHVDDTKQPNHVNTTTIFKRPPKHAQPSSTASSNKWPATMRQLSSYLILSSTIIVASIILLLANTSLSHAQTLSTTSKPLATSADETEITDIGDETLEDELDGANLLLISQKFDYRSSMPVITRKELNAAIKLAAQNITKLRDSFEPSIIEKRNLITAFGSIAWLAGSLYHLPIVDIRTLNISYQAMTSEETSKYLAHKYKLTWVQATRGLPLISMDETPLGKECQHQFRPYNCPAGQYRSLTGHCNNVQNPDYGSALTPLIRYAPARYADFIAKPLKSSNEPLKTQDPASLLPSSRAIAIALHEATIDPKVQPYSHLTTMMSFFGQFVVHDLAQVSQYTMGFGQWTAIKCCGLNSAQRHPECLPIEYKDFCLDYVRSLAAVRPGCNLGQRDQLNLVSSYLDGSTIYGSSEEQARNLRTFKGGKLKSTKLESSDDMLPLITGEQQLEVIGSDSTWYVAAQDCQRLGGLRARSKSKQDVQDFNSLANAKGSCFQAGDFRVNENIGLTLMHTIWMREHNYIAQKLSEINSHWQDERLYQEARRIVIAELQHITYSELLPAMLGQDIVLRFNLTVQNQGYSQDYDPQINAGTSNEFASTILPFIKSTIPATLERYNEKLDVLGSIQITDSFMNGAELMRKGRMAEYLIGMISQSAIDPSQSVSNIGTNGLSVASYNSTNKSHELPKIDFVAYTIQQARDHGIRGYLYWRNICLLTPKIRTWQDLEQVIPERIARRLSKVYTSPNQLDIYIAQYETPISGAAVGPTLACIMARQFYHLKHGDRYWFENDLPIGSGSFTASQLDEIRQSSLAKILCRNLNSEVTYIQPNPLYIGDQYLNAYQYCTNKAMNGPNFDAWYQSLTTARQLQDEQYMNELRVNNHHSLDGDQSVSIKSDNDRVFLIPQNDRRRRSNVDPKLVESSLASARAQFEDLAYEETRRIRTIRGQQTESRKQPSTSMAHAGYRYLGRPKRQTLLINNQSLLFELATNELVRSMLHQGKDREWTQSLQNDIREFLYSLETAQLDNLVDNTIEGEKLESLAASANSGFLTAEQRSQLIQANDPMFGPDPLLESMQQVTSSSPNEPQCQDDAHIFPCDHTSPFRTMTGWCNNLNNPKFGASFTQHDRLLPSSYDDGLSKPRSFSVLLDSNKRRVLLPSPRLISTTIHDGASKLHTRYSLALMQFGQFAVDHDLTRTPFGVAIDGSLLDCSPCNSRETVHRDCMPIPIPDQDSFYHSPNADQALGNKKRCLHFVRSLNGQAGLGPRQQINALTSYFDGSEIYGSDNCEAKSLRSLQGGRLNSSAYLLAASNLQRSTSTSTSTSTSLTSSAAIASFKPNTNNFKDILPITKANPECVTPGGVCFHAGDQRASEQPALSAIHTIFMRLHNHIVGQLAAINSHWNDERLYQQGRRIVGAILQRITYEEFVPRLLGLDFVSKYDLMPKETGYSNDYDPTCSGSIINEFAAAAFRVGHSLLRNAFPLLDRNYKEVGQSIQLRKAFFNTQRIMTEPQLIDSILRGIVSTPIESLDNSVTDEVTNHLFEKPKEPFSGMDLVSLNIQRARDHGITGYNKYRVKCNLSEAKTFRDLSNEIAPELIDRLEKVYAHVDDIDLFTGGLSERPVHGGSVGPTFGCIIGLQFKRLKVCDRFWHETNDPWIRFSPPQLAEIRKMTLAKVLCQHSDAIDTIQRNVMDINDTYL